MSVSQEGCTAMTTGLVYLRPIRVAFVRCYGPYAESSAEAWDTMFAWIEKHGLRNGELDRGYGLSQDNPAITPVEKCRYDACIELPISISELDASKLNRQTLPGGAYARQRHTGPYSELTDAIRSIRDDWVPTHGLGVDPNRPLVNIHLDDPAFCPVEKLRTDLCLPVTVVSDSNGIRPRAA